MRRVLIIAAIAAAPLAIAWLVLNKSDGPSSRMYRVDAIFDHSRGLIPGQLVEVAGARVGKIDDVTLTGDYKARIQMSVSRRFAPFRADARCSIHPQGLIAENYVQCDPGRTDSPELKGRGGQAPTVPVDRTSEPVNLTDLFEVWNVPTRERLTVLISQLGLATSARGPELNGILRRANPALAQARNVISQLERQQGELTGALDDTSTVVASLARDPDATKRLVRHAANVVTRTGRHAGDLQASIAKLPPLLEQARPTLRSLDTVITTGTPLLASLHRSAPALDSLTRDLGPLSDAAKPAMAKLGPVLGRGAGVLKESAPLTKLMANYAHRSLPSAQTAGKLLANLRERGFSENLMRFFYYAAAATARFDSTSHILPAHIDTSVCGTYATTPVDGCTADYTEPTQARRATHRKHRARQHARTRAEGPGEAPPSQAPAAQPQAPKVPAVPALPAIPELKVPKLPGVSKTSPPPDDQTVEKVLGYLLG